MKVHWLQTLVYYISNGKKPGFLSMVLSVLASAFGVQSHQNYERDFNHGHLAGYIVIGVIFVGLLVLGLALLVNAIIN